MSAQKTTFASIGSGPGVLHSRWKTVVLSLSAHTSTFSWNRYATPQISTPTTNTGRRMRFTLIPAIRIIVVSLSRVSLLIASEQPNNAPAGRASMTKYGVFRRI